MLPERIGAPVQAIAWVLDHVSAIDIVLIIHAWTLHRLVRGNLTLDLRVGKKLVVKVSKADVSDRTL